MHTDTRPAPARSADPATRATTPTDRASNSSDPAHTAIAARGLGRSFGDHDAVAGIDLEIRRGEIYGFLGPNGAGKSTTVRMLCTLLAPTTGQATVAGHDLADHPDRVRLHIGAALQEAALDPVQSGRALLRLQARLYGLPRKHVDQRVDELAALVDLGDALDRPIGTYSGGMRRRLDLAAALVHHPDILFLDEPTTGLDPTSRTKVWDEVRRLNEELGMTIFLTTQYLEEADALADRIGIINDGRIVAEGSPEVLKRRVGRDVITAQIEGDVESARQALLAVDGVESVAVAEDGGLRIETADGGATIGPAAIALGRAGLTITGLALRSTTLDDVFLELTGSRIASSTNEEAAGDSDLDTDSTHPDHAHHDHAHHDQENDR